MLAIKGRSHIGLPQFGNQFIDYRGSGRFERQSLAEGGAGGRFYIDLKQEGIAYPAHVGGILTPSFTRGTSAWLDGVEYAPGRMRVVGLDTDSPAVLIENIRTNLIPHSQYVVTTTYSVGDGDRMVIHEREDGETAYVKYDKVSTVGTDLRAGQDAHATGLDPAKTYTVSFEFKSSEYTTRAPEVLLDGTALNAFSNNQKVALRLLIDGSVQLVNETVRAWAIPLPDGFTRYSFVIGPDFFGDSTGDTLRVRIATGWTNLASYEFWFRHPQIEQYAHPSSYIPTTGEPVERKEEWFRHHAIAEVFDIKRPWTVHCAYRSRYSGTYNQGPAYSFSYSGGNSSDGSSVVELRVGGGYGHALWLGGGLSTTGQVYQSLGAAPTEWTCTTVTFNGESTVTIYKNGAYQAQASWTPDMQPDLLTIGTQARQMKAHYGLIAPGAPALGIPFIDNYQWPEERIIAAHETWLDELSQIELLA